MSVPASSGSVHALVIPVYGNIAADFPDFCAEMTRDGLVVIVVNNNPTSVQGIEPKCVAAVVENTNRGGIGGGFNRGVEEALRLQAEWVTLLDQDSRIATDGLRSLVKLLLAHPAGGMVVGPSVWDERRMARHGRIQDAETIEWPTRLLISSGTTFRSCEWTRLGQFNQDLFIDFVDHAWCFRAQSRGFRLVQHSRVLLSQEFGSKHPSQLCHLLGMQLYTSSRHYYAIRNLRWLVLQPFVPVDLKLKELIKMFFKPWLWILFEPHRLANLQAVLAGLMAPLPRNHP